MVRKGLNTGDFFSDGERMFRVTRVLENGDYISEAVAENQDDPKKETAPDMDDSLGTQEHSGTAEDGNPAAGSYTKRQIQRMNKADMLALAEELGIDTSGKAAETKEAIIRKLGL